MINKIDTEKIKEYRLKGLLYSQTHPTLDLTILNYTAQCAWERNWDEITLAARGLVLNTEGVVVGRCLEKFFNLSEHTDEEIPHNLDFEVFTKCDGSYIQLFWYNSQWVVSSRGSFTSDQAQWAKDILVEKYSWELFELPKENTYIFELIDSKRNRIVVDYGEQQDLILLAIINTATGVELSVYDPIVSTWGKLNVVQKHDLGTDLSGLKSFVKDNEEGFVVKYSNGFRVKIKGDEYVRLHKLMTNMTSKDVWTAYVDGETFEKFIEPLPDEMFDWVSAIWTEMQVKYLVKSAEILNIFNKLKYEDELSTRKEWAIAIHTNYKKYSGLLFNLLDDNIVDFDKGVKKYYCEPPLQKCWVDSTTNSFNKKGE